jgi:hypothetical protein
MRKAKFKNGDILKDIVTGLKGVVMVVAHYSTGCIHYGIQEQRVKDDGTLNRWEWLDQSRFVLVEDSAVVFDIDSNMPSGPMPSGPQA